MSRTKPRSQKAFTLFLLIHTSQECAGQTGLLTRSCSTWLKQADTSCGCGLITAGEHPDHLRDSRQPSDPPPGVYKVCNSTVVVGEYSLKKKKNTKSCLQMTLANFLRSFLKTHQHDRLTKHQNNEVHHTKFYNLFMFRELIIVLTEVVTHVTKRKLR